MFQRAHRLLTLPRAERTLVVRALAVYARVRWSLWRGGLAEVQRLHASASATDSRAAEPRLPPARVSRLVAGALRPLGANCLGESLTLALLLQRLEYPALLRIGARRAQTGIEAHAWVELDGVPLNDRPDIAAHYSPFGDQPDAESRFV
jgi:hypothetical protein